MARKLHNRLALASYKTQHGQEGLAFKDIEARLESTLKRKRSSSSRDTSTSSSTSPGLQIFTAGIASSPMAAPLFSDDIYGSGHSISRKSNMFPSAMLEGDRGSSKRLRSHSMAPPLYEASRTSWKSNYNLPESSPVHAPHNGRYQSKNGLSQSFASEVSTIPDSPPFGHLSDGDHSKLPVSAFRIDSASFHASPPRTPPPTRHRHQKGIAGGGEEGADLLLYLATSPSPANPGHHARIVAPSTPPSNTYVLPSSMLSTPGLAGFNTPGQPFNFADFVNVTPSPAQGAFGNRTPALTKTPLAAKEARRRLNFDSLVPPIGSPNLSNVGRGSMGKESGLGMELGGELVSSQ